MVKKRKKIIVCSLTAIVKADENAQYEAEKFFQMARLKTDDYSKIDIVKMASTMGGLLLDENMVEPVHIPEDVEERSEAARAIYGPDMKAESEPFKDPVSALEAEEEESNAPERIRSPPNLYEALQSNFLKSNYVCCQSYYDFLYDPLVKMNTSVIL